MYNVYDTIIVKKTKNGKKINEKTKSDDFLKILLSQDARPLD